MRAILLSVQPKLLEKILNGEKTVEIRKSMPKCELPVEVYLYCTKGTPLYTCGHLTFRQEVFDDVERHSDIDIKTQGHITNIYGKPIYRLNSKVVAKFTLREVENIFHKYNCKPYYFRQLQRNACLGESDIYCYAGNNDIYAWHISDLFVFDKPMALGEFYIFDPKNEDTFICVASAEQHYKKCRNKTACAF